MRFLQYIDRNETREGFPVEDSEEKILYMRLLIEDVLNDI
jgi:hypothetical protein